MTEDELPLSDIQELNAVKQVALSYVTDAFAEAELDGLDADCMAQAALFAAFMELIAAHGEEVVAQFAQTLPDKIRSGGFSAALKH